MSVDNYYKVGGSLEYQHPTYVVRKADSDLYEGLKNGDFCYVLNSRQMGKSSLRVQTMKKLKDQGIKCASIDMTRIGSHVSPQELYGGVVSELLRCFSLSRKVNFSTWWRQREFLQSRQRLSDFIEDVLLAEFSQKIVIFIDEIDSVIKIEFKDDFFSFIRACYNHRADNPEYKRLTFCLLGVATPSDLIADKNLSTPFNIGRAIELTGFQLDEATPLAQGLAEKSLDSKAVLREVLAWTGGQPFLTQKLCKLLLATSESIPEGGEAAWVENLVRSQIISNWETQDEPEHLRTIRDRILRSEQRAVRLIGLYKKILQHGEIKADGSPEQMELRLSGLVVKQQGSLRVYNRIYEAVFNSSWVNKALSDLRPYAEALEAWVVSGRQDESQLLQGQALRDAQVWAEGKRLNIGTGNQTAISALVKLLESTKDESTRKKVAFSLGKIAPGNQTAISALVKLLVSTKDESTRWEVVSSLREIGTGNQTAISALVKLLVSTEDESTRWEVVSSLNQLLDLQRLDAGRMQPSFRPRDLVEFVGQIIEFFRPYCEKKGLQLVTDLSYCPPLYLDTEKFDKVIYNLLSNAMKFTSAGGKITVRLKPAGDHCLLQVKDTGIGIRTEQIPHLFQRFYQAEGAAFRSYEGSGLGLALVKELVELHKGQISVESVYGEGSTFTVWLQTGIAHLPLDQVLEVRTEVEIMSAAVELADLELVEETSVEERASHTEDASVHVEAQSTESLVASSPCFLPSPLPQSLASSSLILVVDDNSDLRTYVSSILRSSGYQVQTACNGVEGFRVAQNHEPDLIVTDLMMPQMSGMDMIWLLRKDEKLKGTPIILLTAKTDEETRIYGTESGADAYLAKPFNDRELKAEVRNLLALKANERRVVELNTYLTESVLKRFLPTALVNKAAKGELLLDLHPETRLITILFIDIVGFTQLAQTLRSLRVAQLLNEYLEKMTRAVFDNGGTVDKFMGDAILAIFGAPEELTPNEQVRRAIATARAMHRSLSLLNQSWLAQGLVGTNRSAPVQSRCGIHQGTAVVGMFGSAERTDYTAIGPSVNIAARLQQAAAPGCILVSAVVADYLEEDEIIKRSPLELRGVDETVLTFSVKPEAD